jgi:nucleotide-binding universal stress UspA family protein
VFDSVAFRCLHHASCPVMLVGDDRAQLSGIERDEDGEATKLPQLKPGSVVAGHDGSRNSDRAVQAAAELARAFAAPMAVVRCWTVETMPRGVLWKDGYVVSFDQASEAVGRQLRAEIGSIIDHWPDIEIGCYGVLGDARETLERLSRNASYLTVGSRGRGGFRALLLGSVGTYCAQRAQCPTLIVPNEPHRRVRGA